MKIVFALLLLVLLHGCKHVHQPNEQVADNALHQTIDSLIAESKRSYNQTGNQTIPFDSLLHQADSLIIINHLLIRQVELYNIVAKRHRNISEFANAIGYYQKSLSLAEILKSDSLKAYTIHEMAVTLRRIDDNAEALNLHMQALELAQNIKDTFLIHSSLNGIGNVYFSYNNLTEALTYFHRSLQYLGKTNPNLLGEAINTNNIGEGWLFLGNPDSALFYLERSFAINVKIGSKLGQAICHNGMGNVYMAKNQYANALKSYEASLAMNRTIGDVIYTADNLRNIGKVYLAVGNYTMAESNLIDAHSIASEIGSKSQIMEASKTLSQLYDITGKTKLALTYNRRAMAYRDTINEEISRQNSLAMEELFKARQLERELLITKQQADLKSLNISRQRYIILSIAVLFLLGMLLLIFVLRQRKLNSRLSELGLEQKLLRAQLNPHFVFNSLAAVQNYILHNDKNAASEYLVNFSRLMRNILMASGTDVITLRNEIEILDDYLRLQQLRFQGKFDYFFEIDPELDTELTLVPPMLIQPFVENSIEHGFAGLSYQGVLIIKFRRMDAFLQISVDDNGKGISLTPNPAKKNHVSMATTITKQRLQTIQALTKTNCKFTISDKKNTENSSGVLVELAIPYQSD